MMNAAPSPDDQQFCLRWNNHQTTIIANFDSLLQNSMLVDCTLAAEGRIVKAHKVVLSACSPYFATLLIQNYDKHPIFILKDVKFKELEAMMDYMYRGEVNVSQDQLPYLLKAAESLQIKGLSDRGSSGEPKPEDDEDQREHRGMNVPGGIAGVKLPGGYTLEQAHVTPASKRVRIGGAPPSSMDTQNVSGSREGSSSPSRRRRKVRRRSIENAMTAEVHDNSNSSQIQSNQSLLLLQQQQQQQQSNASLAGVGAITAAASALASQIPVSGATASAGTTAGSIAQVGGTTAQQMTTSGGNGGVTKKTENVKGTSDAMNTENIQAAVGGAVGGLSSDEHMKSEKQNHKQQKGATGSSNKDKDAAETMVIEPKSEYDEEGNDETVEDLTLDDEEMGMDDLDQNAGTSQGGEGSSQGYAPWQHERSQDELLLATQEQQQRDPQDNYSSLSHPAIAYNMNNNNNTATTTATAAMIATMKRSPKGRTMALVKNGRFQCANCPKHYLRKRHLQRHERDECVGVQPRFSCPFCTSKFRRKYHMVRHLKSKEGIPYPTVNEFYGNAIRDAPLVQMWASAVEMFRKHATASDKARRPKDPAIKCEDMPTMSESAAHVNRKSPAKDSRATSVSSENSAIGSSSMTSGSLPDQHSDGRHSPHPENLTVKRESPLSIECDVVAGLHQGVVGVNGCTSANNSPNTNMMLPPMPPSVGFSGAITAFTAAAQLIEDNKNGVAGAARGIGGGGNLGRNMFSNEELAAAAAAAASIWGAQDNRVKAESIAGILAQSGDMNLLQYHRLLQNRMLGMNMPSFTYENNEENT